MLIFDDLKHRRSAMKISTGMLGIMFSSNITFVWRDLVNGDSDWALFKVLLKQRTSVAC